MHKFVTAEPFPPGEYIQEELDARGWTQGDLAQILRITLRQVSNLIAGKSAITPETATALGAAFGQDPATWMNLQVTYELSLAAKKDRDTARRAYIFDKVPVREMIKRCWLPDVDETQELEDAIRKFLRIENIKDEPQMSVAARKSTTYARDTSAQIAWYMRARQLAESVRADRYDGSQFSTIAVELLTLAKNPEDARLLPAKLAEMGIRLVLVKHLKGTKIEGAAFWLDSASPAIALSLRYDRMDNLWFNIFHEMIHINYRHEPHVDVQDDGSIATAAELPEIELIANTEAANYLIPKDKIESFIRRMKPLYYQDRVVQFAQARGIHPAIVVGQLHKRGELDPRQLRKLLVPIREFIVGQALTDGWGSDLCLD
jgi:HTH-type transcriptional regulator/antitoxin HigA